MWCLLFAVELWLWKDAADETSGRHLCCECEPGVKVGRHGPVLQTTKRFGGRGESSCLSKPTFRASRSRAFNKKWRLLMWHLKQHVISLLFASSCSATEPSMLHFDPCWTEPGCLSLVHVSSNSRTRCNWLVPSAAGSYQMLLQNLPSKMCSGISCDASWYSVWFQQHRQQLRQAVC